MSAIGRNEPCRCGSGKKTKRCCGVPHGPSDAELARAFVATHAGQAVGRLRPRPDAELHDLLDEMLELPARHLSLQLRLPRLFSPEIEALRDALEDDDPDRADDELEAALAAIDTPQQRAGLARAVLDLAQSGQVDGAVADTAMVDLDSRWSSLMRMSLLQAVLVSVGARRTPSGLLVASL